jgi:hypothetical protein
MMMHGTVNVKIDDEVCHLPGCTAVQSGEHELEICEQESSATIFMDMDLQSISIYTRLYGVTS